MRTAHPTVKSDLEGHYRRWDSCEKCPFFSPEKTYWRGTLPCDVIFISGQLRIEDIIDGDKEPISGWSGRILETIIDLTKETSEDFSWAAVDLMACPSWTTLTRTRPPNDTDIENCWPRLVEFMEIAQAHTIVAAGSLVDETLIADLHFPSMRSISRLSSQKQTIEILKQATKLANHLED